jgi:hypothetical protein
MMKIIIRKIWVLTFLVAISVPVLGLDDEEQIAVKAIKNGDVGALKNYLEKHPDLNCLFSNGKTGLYYAIDYDQFSIAEFLLGQGADPEFMISGVSTLEWAIRHTNERVARLLIEYGADVNRADEKQDTPLIHAAELNSLELCKLLIARGANPLHVNSKDKTASDIAYYYDASPAYKYLVSMEDFCRNLASMPSMHDGPYISWEEDKQIILTYYERDQARNFTRLIEKTIRTGKKDTIVNGIGRDKNSYHISYAYSPQPEKVETAGDIFAIGDLHGRYNALINLLKNNNIIDSSLNWNFGNGQFVLLGDIFDRGDSVTETLWFLHELEIQARSSGGNIHLLLGNHEIMELIGDDRYLSDKYRYFTRYTSIDYYQLYERNTVLGSWLRSKNVILQVNDNLFLHAGISPEFAVYNYPYAEINSRVRRYLSSDDRLGPGSPEDIILGPIGPLWYRGYYTGNTSDNDSDSDNYSSNVSNKTNFPVVKQEFVDTYLASKGLKRMITGHNEHSAISSAYQGKVISIDVAIDKSGKSAQGLLISGEKLYRCLADGTRQELK